MMRLIYVQGEKGKEMSSKLVCDLCGEIIPDRGFGSRIIRLKIDRYRGVEYSCVMYGGTGKFDICEECMAKIADMFPVLKKIQPPFCPPKRD